MDYLSSTLTPRSSDDKNGGASNGSPAHSNEYSNDTVGVWASRTRQLAMIQR